MTLILYLLPLLFLFEEIFNTGILKNLKDSKVSKDFEVQYIKKLSLSSFLIFRAEEIKNNSKNFGNQKSKVVLQDFELMDLVSFKIFQFS